MISENSLGSQIAGKAVLDTFELGIGMYAATMKLWAPSGCIDLCEFCMYFHMLVGV